MAAPSKTKKIESLAKFLQKRYKGLPGPPERDVLEHLIYAALLENAVAEQADSAMSVLEHHFIDWNEVRVSTINELADVFSMLPAPHVAGDRVRKALQGIFEKTYLFDLEDLRKKGKNLSQAVGFLESVGACSRFMIDYTAQVAFGGHIIPLDEASLRIFRLLGLAQVNKEGTREDVPGLERAVAKKSGPAFSNQLHRFAAEFFDDPESVELRTLLKPIDPEALKRDWTPPVLTLPKAPEKPVVKRSVPAATLAFAAVEDDDFDEEQGGTEAEFLSDDETAFTEKTVEKASSKDEKTKKGKAEKDKPVSKKNETKSAEKIKTAAKPEAEPSVGKKKDTEKKSEGKKSSSKKPVKSEGAPEKESVKKSESVKPEKSTKKSPTRQLREKKPK